MIEKNKEYGFSTLAIHAGQTPDPSSGAIMTPIFQSSTFVQKSPGVHSGYEYARTGTPTRTALQANLAALEGGKFGVCFSSGCGAADTVMHLFDAGDHIICEQDVYGGTFRLFNAIFKRVGLEFSFVDLTDQAALAAAVRPNTKLIWTETPTNPMLKLIDIESVCTFARQKKILSLVDNTFASPYLQNPLALGADLVLHSTTKYIGGHSDVVGGVLITNNQELAERLYYLQNAVGSVSAPFDCFLQLRSTKTLAVRMERHCDNAEKMAEFLAARSDVERVIYPGLSSHPQHQLARRQMKRFGGMITMTLKGGLPRARKFLETVRLFSLAESLGGVESLIEHPAIMTHASIPPEIRAQLGISDGLVRLSVGIEDSADQLEDIRHALDASL